VANPKKGRWVLLSDGNADNLARFFRGCREQGIETQGVVFNCPPGDFDWPANWKSTGTIAPKAGDEWFGILWGDQCPQSPKWDIQLVNSVQPWNVVTSVDAIHADWRQGAVVWGTEGLKAAAGPNVNPWEFFSRELDFEEILHGWMIGARESKAWLIERVSLPRKVQPTARAYAQAFAPIAPALSACMASHGVRVCEPNYDGVSLMISTPSISTPAVEYMISLMMTQRELVQMEVPSEWSLERFNADICMARSHIVAEFLRTQHTHLLMVDDDMTWEPQAVHRLFYANQDIVAVAGCKKAYPLRFAASKVDDKGMPVPLQMIPELGAAEVDFVGAAFMLVKREALEKMVQAYPELMYTGSDGKLASALFLQQIENGTYRPEDFSFCSRWRKIGGRIYICPDVAIGHIGQHEYKGDLWGSNRVGAQ